MILGDLFVLALLAAPVAALLALFRADPSLLTPRFVPPAR
jgi:hypothetical protein